jgi:hypothetical protein
MSMTWEPKSARSGIVAWVMFVVVYPIDLRAGKSTIEAGTSDDHLLFRSGNPDETLSPLARLPASWALTAATATQTSLK